MTKQTPNFLRLHVEEAEAKSAAGSSADVLSGICAAFTKATGWRLELKPSSSQPGEDEVWRRDLPEERGTPSQTLVLVRANDTNRTEPSVPAIVLAENLSELIENLYDTRRALWRSEGELAAGVALVEHPDEAHHLAARLEGVLQGVTEAVEGKAAALYLLDDATTQLKLRSCWNLPNDRFVTKGRPLASAVGDLEALAGSAVVIENVSLLPHWQVPEDFAAAACVPVSSPTTPLGTLWVFDDKPRDFLATQTNLMEICAGRIAADLERELLLTRVSELNQVEQQTAAIRAQCEQQIPATKPSSGRWDIAGRCLRGRQGGGGFYEWLALPNGQLLLCLGDTEQRGLTASFSAAQVLAAVRALSTTTGHPGQIVSAVDQMLRSTSCGGQIASIWAATVGELDATLEVCTSGSIGVIQVGSGAPTSHSHVTRFCGADGEDDPFRQTRLPLQSGQSLCIVNDGVRKAQDADGEPFGEAAIADAASAVGDGNANDILDAVTSALFAHAGPTLASDCSILVAKAI